MCFKVYRLVPALVGFTPMCRRLSTMFCSGLLGFTGLLVHAPVEVALQV